MLAAVILAAGESRRMGSPKALLPYRGTTFTEHLVAATRHARVGMTRVVLGAKAEEIRPHLHVDATDIVVNTNWQQGQLSSIQTAIRSLPPNGTDGLILCPVDHALVSAQLVASLIENFDLSRKLIAMPNYRGQRGHPVIFRSSLYEEILSAPAEVGARQVVWNHSADILEILTEEEGSILNLNDPEALERATGTRLLSKDTKGDS